MLPSSMLLRRCATALRHSPLFSAAPFASASDAERFPHKGPKDRSKEGLGKKILNFFFPLPWEETNPSPSNPVKTYRYAEEMARGKQRYIYELEQRGLLHTFAPTEPQGGPFGTVDAPAVITTHFKSRIVGCAGPKANEHEILWFNLEMGNPQFCRECGQVFTLERVKLDPCHPYGGLNDCNDYGNIFLHVSDMVIQNADAEYDRANDMLMKMEKLDKKELNDLLTDAMKGRGAASAEKLEQLITHTNQLALEVEKKHPALPGTHGHITHSTPSHH